MRLVLLSSPLGDAHVAGVSSGGLDDISCQLPGGLETLSLEAPLLDVPMGDEGYAVVGHSSFLLYSVDGVVWLPTTPPERCFGWLPSSHRQVGG